MQTRVAADIDQSNISTKMLITRTTTDDAYCLLAKNNKANIPTTQKYDRPAALSGWVTLTT